MGFRLVLLTACCLAAVNGFSQSERVHGETNFGRHAAFGSDRIAGGDEGDSISRSDRQGFQNPHGVSGFGQHGSQDSKFGVDNEGSTFGRPVGTSNNRESGHHSTGSSQQHLSGQQSGGSGHNTVHREGENRPSGSRPSSSGDSSFGRPGSSSHTTNNREDENRPFGSRPSSSGDSFHGRPTGSSSHITDNRESESRPFGSRPSSSGDSSHGRPTGSSGHTTDHREGENRPFGSRPGSSGGNSFERPTGGSGHTTDNKESENRPSGSRPSSSGDSSFGRPGSSSHNTNNREDENRPFGSRPGSSGGSSHGRPTGSSSHITDNTGSESRPFGSRPGSSGDSSHGRPTGSSSHVTDNTGSESRPFGSSSGDSSFGRPTGGSSHTTDHKEGENRPFGSRPSNSGDNSFGRPTGGSSSRPDKEDQSFGGTNQRPGSQQNTGDSSTGLNEFSNRPDTDSNSQSNSENEKNDKDKKKDTSKDKDNEGKEEEKDVCFTHLGCFKMGKPWKTALRPIGAPHGPEKIQTTIQFYSRNNLERPKYIPLYPQIEMGEANFDPSKITAMIIHGFSNSGNATWMKEMKDVYLDKVDANLMIVDWGKGAQLLNYFQVAGNTRVVGKQLGVFLKFLIDKYGADPGKFHLIGHSLGAQISSYVGKEVQGIARLTAMDPAQPAFEGFDKEVRLDKNDAEFVDVIHTDARPFIPTLGFGMIAPHGHVDFYMNGGFDQPGCVPPSKRDIPSVNNVLDLAKFPVEVIARTVACPHARAYEYLIEAFNETESCIFWGHKADAKNVFKSVTNTLTQGLLKKFTALSPTCHKEDCIPLGFATKKSPLRGVFVVTTNGKMPYCISEPGIPPETPPQERKHDSFIQKIGRKTRVIN